MNLDTIPLSVQLDCALNALSLINGIFTIVEDKDKFHADLRSLNIRGKLEVRVCRLWGGEASRTIFYKSNKLFCFLI